ncbi:hypothetical protein CPB84DRAFT_1386435 [Gymnopilus junonius]|uniref:Uncharacterized protein n=1 Tax=Gymnopilus junonius TaxID=109634 RepID=A0A9P5TK87_GYMJU|nr:hypothetical protein CPB84DRAFT_1386435 [Gymnopilus junonius]
MQFWTWLRKPNWLTTLALVLIIDIQTGLQTEAVEIATDCGVLWPCDPRRKPDFPFEGKLRRLRRRLFPAKYSSGYSGQALEHTTHEVHELISFLYRHCLQTSSSSCYISMSYSLSDWKCHEIIYK